MKVKKKFSLLLVIMVIVNLFTPYLDVVKAEEAKVYTADDVKNHILSAGSGYSMMVKDGVAYSWGKSVVKPKEINDLSNVIAVSTNIASGSVSSFAVTEGNILYAWGYNYTGQLGLGDKNFRNTPEYSMSDVIAVSGGKEFSIVLKSDGTVYSCGFNTRGQLGLGYKDTGFPTSHTYPSQVTAVSNVTAISTGSAHSLALLSDGTVYSWGSSGSGQLGNGGGTDGIPKKVIGLSGANAISAGSNHSLALKNDGTVWAWGNNSDGQLGDGTNTQRDEPVQTSNLSNIIAISAGSNHSLALKNDGTVWAWGNNDYGQLGDETNAQRDEPVQVSNLSNIIAISAGDCHNLAMNEEGDVWAWGKNSDGQLGDGTKNDRNKPVKLGKILSYPKAVYGGEDNKELFLRGKYIELGISNWGDFGTIGNKPKGFRGTRGGEIGKWNGSDRVGMSADHDGFKEGRDLPVDYYLPGSPEERFVVGYKQGGQAYTNTNSAQMRDENMDTSVLNLSSLEEGKLKAKVVSTWKDKMKITQIISFDQEEMFYRNEVTLKNISNEDIENARYMRNFDPDNSQFRGGSFTTENKILLTHEAGDGKAVVRAQTIAGDSLYGEMNTRTPIFFYSKDPAAKVSAFGFTNTNPYNPLAYDNARQKGYEEIADRAINITWDAGNLVSGEESQTFVYYTSLDNRVFKDVIDDIEKDEDKTTNTPTDIGENGPTYTVTFKDYDDTTIDVSVKEGLPATLPADPVRDGYTFSGWEVESGSGSLFKVTGDLTVKATYEEISNPKTVTFDSQGGSSVPSITVETGNTIQEPEIPTWDGHKFKGWVTEVGGDTLWFFDNAEVNEDMTLYASWEDTANKVVFKETEKIDSITVEIGTTSEEALERFPETIEIIDSNKDRHEVDVTWSWKSDGVIYDSNNPGFYGAWGEFELPSSIDWENGQRIKAEAVACIESPETRVTSVEIYEKTGEDTIGIIEDNVVKEIEYDGSLSLVASVSPNAADCKRVKWSSGDTTIATVNSKGVVTPVATGNTTITVTSDDGGKTDTVDIKVMPSDECEVTEWITPADLTVNETGVTKTVDRATDSETIDVNVSENATWKLYSDENCNSEIADKIVNLDVGENTAYLRVLAEDGKTAKVYTVTITREKSKDADLADLVLSSGTLDPDFASDTLSYTAIVNSKVTEVTVTPTLSSKWATMKVNGQDLSDATVSDPISLPAGGATITITVTAEDTTEKTYTIEVLLGAADTNIIKQPRDKAVTEGNTATFTVEANTTDGGNLTYQWQSTSDGSTWQDIAEALNASYTTEVLAPEDSGTHYRCVVTNHKNGTQKSVPSNSAKLTVNKRPTAETFSPANGETNVAIDSNLEILFNENMKKGTGYITLYKEADNTVVEEIYAGSSNIQLEEKKVIITLDEPLEYSTSYYLNIDSTCFQGTVENDYKGITDKSTWSFTTEKAPDLEVPYVVATDPKNKEKKVDVDQDIEITFSEEIMARNMNLLTLEKEGSITEYVYDIDDNVLTLDPLEYLDYGSTYTVDMGEGTVTDAVYNPQSAHQITFTTINNEAGLRKLTLSEGSLSPDFTEEITKYTTKVEYDISELTIVPTTVDPEATIRVNGTTETSGEETGALDLDVGENTITIEVTAEDGTSKIYTIKVTRAKKESNSESSDDSSHKSSGSSDKKKDIDVEVNGKKQESLGQAETKYQRGQKVTTVKINEERLAEKLAQEGKKSLVTIPLENEKGTVRGELNGQMVKNMEQQEAVLEIKTAKAGYTLPAKQIKIDEVSRKIGQEVELQDIKVTVEIGETPQEMVQVVENTAKKDEFTLVVPPVDFTVNCSYGDKTVEARKFSNYVERTIAIPAGVDHSKITTGLIAYPDGTTCHVPTKVIKLDGKYYAQINSLTNSTYTIIWNPKEYQDVQGHWAQEVCNEMGARKVVAETTSTTFKPDEPITRLFFTQTLVRALGLGDKGTEYRFSDVDQSKSYYGAVATGIEYGLVKGYQDNTFKAFNNVTREEASALILRAMKIAGLKTDYTKAELQNELDKFVDKDEIGTWAREVVAICVKNGLIVGNERDEFMPKGKMTKAELAAIMMRMLEKAELI